MKLLTFTSDFADFESLNVFVYRCEEDSTKYELEEITFYKDRPTITHNKIVSYASLQNYMNSLEEFFDHYNNNAIVFALPSERCLRHTLNYKD